MTHNPIIVALDLESAGEARALAAQLGPRSDFYKVGMELYAAAGMDFVRELQAGGKQVFLDLKLYDIPETVKRAVAQVARAGVQFVTVHAVGSVSYTHLDVYKRQGVSWYTPASSAVSNPTSTLALAHRGILPSTWSKILGLNFDAHPPAFTWAVSFLIEVPGSMASLL